jgi:hypothetical protein
VLMTQARLRLGRRAPITCQTSGVTVASDTGRMLA